MNNFNFRGATVRTMTSREIAELAGKEHKNVLADIRAMLDELGLDAPEFSGTYRTERGNEYECFNLPKRETLILVSGYSVAMRARIIDRWEALESGAAVPIAAAAPKLLPIDLLEQAQALKTLLGDDELKRLAPLLWQEIADGAQNAMRRALGAPLALPAPDAPKLLDVVEIAKAAGIDLPQNLRGAAGKYVKARVAHIETERIIAGSIRKSAAYCDHAAVADALREYLGKRAASQPMLG